ncbi:ParB N-terminal domain-containing protein [Simplicispira metamorpha]|uniref:ParB-like nuclease family protein n=2 Tax=Simplicispira metamorpha TaxID=80881 RepID=A0A4R2NDF8_9BURK|nr:ParB N-terminal domain-containing protein [Simplicispira metamorpha]TCP19118.1 ParB-like nuclease family protein [Simplicispira metamorpha]
MLLNLHSIRIDGGTQSRAELNNTTVEEYTEAMLEGAAFPPIVVFFDGASYWLADGFHRYFGADHAGLDEVDAEVRQGTQQDAQLFSFGVNASHGLRRTNADKRKAVTGALQHPVSGQWGDRQIAKHCGVDHKTVAAVRAAIWGNSPDTPTERTVTRNGTSYQQNTTNIGKTDRPAPAAIPAPAPAAPLPKPVVVVPPPKTSQPDHFRVPHGEGPPEGMNEDDFGPSPEEIAEAEAADRAERELVEKMLAADDKMAMLFDEVKMLKAQVDRLERHRDELMNKAHALDQIARKRDRENLRLLKQLDELKKGGAR